MVTFQAFIDDSGSGKPVFILSGYISRRDWWEDFSDDWQHLLDEAPAIKYFKMREAATLHEQFAGAKPQARNERIKKFFSLIRKVAHASIISVFPIGLYESVIKGKIPREWDDPYFIALFEIIVKLVSNQVTLESEDLIEFVFDDNPRLAAVVPR